MKITRTKTKASGGITTEEKLKMDEIVKKWTKIAFRTEPINKEKITDAIYRLYEAANLKKPRVVIVPSPFVARLASGIASAVWYLRKGEKVTYAATRDATRAATYAATYDATSAATYAATDAATRDATYAAKTKKTWLRDLISKFTPHELTFTLGCISLSWKLYQAGNMWAYSLSYAEAMRDIIGLVGLDCWEKYQAWEDAGKEGGFRYMHEEFCIVSDFPEILKIDDRNLSHCEDGPSHKWRDGFEIYNLHGVRFPKELFDQVTSGKMPFEEILAIKDIDQRTQAMRFGDVNKFFKHTKSKLLDKSEKGNELWLVPQTAGIFTQDAYFLKYSCPSTSKEYMSGIEPEIGKQKNADYAMSWKHHCLTLNEYWSMVET